MYDEHSYEGYLGVPREWGLDYFDTLDVDDRRSFGNPIVVSRLPSPDHPSVQNPEAQRKFMDDMFACLTEYQSGGAHAETGTGKTVVALHTAARVGRTTLIIVHLERLQKQWVKEIHDKLGVPMSRIGIVQGEKCQFEGRDFVVAMVQSLCSRRYDDAFYQYFGTVFFDESHKMGSSAHARVISMFPCYYRMPMSATWKRADGGHAVFEYHCGPVRVTSEAEALPMDVYVIDFNADHNMIDYDHAAMVKSLAADNARNERLARLALQAYQKGRTLLLVSDQTEQVQKMRNRCIALGVPETETGLFVGASWQWVDDPLKPGKKKKVKVKVDPVELERCQREARMIFATYGMMTEGIDIPRIDAGMDLSPRAKATQLIGRIRRPLPGKRRPLWVTIRDLRSRRAMRYFKARVRDYLSTNVEVVYGNERTGGDAGRSEGVLGQGTQRTTTQAVRGRSAISPRRSSTRT